MPAACGGRDVVGIGGQDRGASARISRAARQRSACSSLGRGERERARGGARARCRSRMMAHRSPCRLATRRGFVIVTSCSPRSSRWISSSRARSRASRCDLATLADDARRPRRRRRRRARAPSSRPRGRDVTASPRLELPSTRVTPAGSRLLPRAERGRRRHRPRGRPGLERAAIQRLRAAPGRRARNQVQRAALAMRRSGCRPAAVGDHHAEPPATRSSRPRSWSPCRRSRARRRRRPAIASISGVISRTSAICGAARRRAGRWRCRGRRCRRAAPGSRPTSSSATRADRRSLSPKRISSVATVSFSLTTGTAPCSRSVARVWRALR